jgi:hypothetical protein
MWDQRRKRLLGAEVVEADGEFWLSFDDFLLKVPPARGPR